MRVSVLPVMAVLTIVAGAIGLSIGEGAIGQIDPLYFQGAAPEVRDVTKDARAQRQPGYADASGWEEGYRARAVDCGDCPVWASRQGAPAQVTVPEVGLRPHWQEASAYRAYEEELAAQEQGQQAQPSPLSRYLHYPVNQEQAQIAASLAVERQAAPERPAAPERNAEANEPAGL
jgi:hypothetical protein